jgi:hypothetical protein
MKYAKAMPTTVEIEKAASKLGLSPLSDLQDIVLETVRKTSGNPDMLMSKQQFKVEMRKLGIKLNLEEAVNIASKWRFFWMDEY